MPQESSPRTVGQNLRVLLPVALFQTVIYTTLNHFQWGPARPLPVTVVDEWFPFWPWTVVPYMLFFVLGFPVALTTLVDTGIRLRASDDQLRAFIAPTANESTPATPPTVCPVRRVSGCSSSTGLPGALV